MDQGERHRDASHPASLVLQNPRQLLNAPVDMRIAGDSVAALLRQRVPVQDEIVWSISTTATHLRMPNEH